MGNREALPMLGQGLTEGGRLHVKHHDATALLHSDPVLRNLLTVEILDC